MGEKARQVTPATKERLYGFSNFSCYKPECENVLLGCDGKTKLGKIAHIEATSSGGARYNSIMNDDERRHFDNLILLCDECHTIVDNPENEREYPVGLLKSWKKEMEDKTKLLKLKKNFLRVVIDKMAGIDFPESYTLTENLNKIPFNIPRKIGYNSVKKNKSLIDEYKVYYPLINSLYQEIEDNGSFKKTNLLRTIKNIYLKVKGDYVKDSENEMEIIRENADKIIDDVREEIFKIISPLIKENVMFEVDLIMVDSFIRCKILEEPPEDDN